MVAGWYILTGKQVPSNNICTIPAMLIAWLIMLWFVCISIICSACGWEPILEGSIVLIEKPLNTTNTTTRSPEAFQKTGYVPSAKIPNIIYWLALLPGALIYLIIKPKLSLISGIAV